MVSILWVGNNTDPNIVEEGFVEGTTNKAFTVFPDGLGGNGVILQVHITGMESFINFAGDAADGEAFGEMLANRANLSNGTEVQA